jgi:hypothetical protein
MGKNLLTKLTLKEVIETLATYDIKHCIFPHNYLAEYDRDIPIIRGLAMGDKNLILLDSEQNLEEMRETIIHELIHTKHYRLGDLRKNIERHVQNETILTYERLYGVKP